jgi:putative tricarboxylic transport membrane protein
MSDRAAVPPRDRGLRADQVAGLALLALAAAVGWQTRALPLGSVTEPGPGYAPTLLVGLLGLLGLAIAALGRHSPRLASLAWPEAGHALKILGAASVATLLIEDLGYRLTVIVLMVFFLGVLERRHPLMVAFVSLGLSLGTYYLFATVLRVPLPLGPWNF